MTKTLPAADVFSFGVANNHDGEKVVELFIRGPRGAKTLVQMPVDNQTAEALAHAAGAVLEQQRRDLDLVQQHALEYLGGDR